jgi:hypothetical protein
MTAILNEKIDVRNYALNEDTRILVTYEAGF